MPVHQSDVIDSRKGRQRTPHSRHRTRFGPSAEHKSAGRGNIRVPVSNPVRVMKLAYRVLYLAMTNLTAGRSPIHCPTACVENTHCDWGGKELAVTSHLRNTEHYWLRELVQPQVDAGSKCGRSVKHCFTCKLASLHHHLL